MLFGIKCLFLYTGTEELANYEMMNLISSHYLIKQSCSIHKMFTILSQFNVIFKYYQNQMCMQKMLF